MVNKKKPPKEVGINEEHGIDLPSCSNDPLMSPVQSNLQPCDSFEVKQESDIKQEPVSISGMVEVSVSTNHNFKHVPDLNERDTEHDFDFVSLKEVKKECIDKKEEEPKTNPASDGMTDSKQDQQPSPQDEGDLMQPESGNDTNNPRKRSNNGHGIPSKPQKCEHCQYSTQRRGHLNRHLLRHTGEKPHGCNFCPKRFGTKQNLDAHMKVHVEEFLFHCPSCLQGFDGMNEKVTHEMNCKVRRYECHLCKKSFGSKKSSMIGHMHVHTGNKPFECNECFKTFTKKCNLYKHMKLHAGPRSFRCSKCYQRFSQQEDRNAHELKCDRRVFECDICGKTFDLNKFVLIHHMRTHSGKKPFECQRCSKQFTRKANLNNHMLLHTKDLSFACLICRRGFSKENERKAHQRNCKGRYYECYLCKKFFQSSKISLKGHMHIHAGVKPFQCEVCHNTFTRESYLKIHIKTIHNKKF